MQRDIALPSSEVCAEEAAPVRGAPVVCDVERAIEAGLGKAIIWAPAHEQPFISTVVCICMVRTTETSPCCAENAPVLNVAPAWQAAESACTLRTWALLHAH